MSRPKKKIDYEELSKEVCKNSWEDEYTKIHRDIIEKKQNRFLFFQCGKGGWGNHIQNMLHSFQVAVITRRAYIDICEIPVATDVFLKPRNVKWNYKVNQTGLTVGKEFLFTNENVKDPSNPKLFERLLTHAIEYQPRFFRFVHLDLSNLIRFNNRTFSEVHQRLGCCFYYLFKKSDILQKHLDAWKSELGFNDNIVLGIHVRHGDYVFNPRYAGADVRLQNDTKQYDFLFGCAGQIERKISEKFRTKRILWYLATDRNALKGYAKNKYGSKVKYITGRAEHIGWPTKGNEEAAQLAMFLDFFLLQESDYRFYPSQSGFHNSIDYLTFGTNDVATVKWNEEKNECVFPDSLKN